MLKFLDIEDREADYQLIYKQTFRAELGLRAVAFMYDDHSNDKHSYDNIVNLKDNIYYRLFAASHQYLVLLRETVNAEKYLQNIYSKNPNYINAFPMGNPYFDKVEQELSSVFDNIIFQVSSIFDYLSHIVCYMLFRDKNNTIYWSRLAKLSRGIGKELSSEMKSIIDIVDRRFAANLYNYRSRLLHNKRDRHYFNPSTTIPDFKFNARVVPSTMALKHFKLIVSEIPNDKKITLIYLGSWIIKRTFIEIESILDVLSEEIKKTSYFQQNLYIPKKGGNSLLFISINPDTNMAEPSSELLWKEYKSDTSKV